jgi:hypothetical protein
VSKLVYSVDTVKTKWTSRYKESSSYDVESVSVVVYVGSNAPSPTSIDVRRFDYIYDAFLPNEQECPTAEFLTKKIKYQLFGDLAIGYKAAQKSYERNEPISLDMVTDTNTLFVKYYDKRNYNYAKVYEMDFVEVDTLIKEKKYGDFTYKGQMMFSTHYYNGRIVYQTFKNVFVIQTDNTALDSPKFIYIDKEYGLVRYILNDGTIYSIVYQY